MPTLTLARSGVKFTADLDETILDAAFRQSIDLPHNCLSGQCRTCITRVLHGRVEHDPFRAPVLNIRPDEVAAGWRLLCSAYARSDAALDR